jgi:hypothetical protein
LTSEEQSLSTICSKFIESHQQKLADAVGVAERAAGEFTRARQAGVRKPLTVLESMAASGLVDMRQEDLTQFFRLAKGVGPVSLDDAEAKICELLTSEEQRLTDICDHFAKKHGRKISEVVSTDAQVCDWPRDRA